MNTVKSLLNQICGTSDEVRSDIEFQLKKHFIDPFYVSRSKSLPENDIMKTDARIVSDAFEAVTNGMYDDEVLKELSLISDNSFFADWKYLTESLYYLYAEDFGKADESFRKIAEDSVPFLTAPVFYRIISREKIASINGLSETEKNFIKSIIKDNINVKTSLDMIETNLKAGQEERFTDNITLLLSDLYSKDRDLSKKLAAWGLKKLSVNDMSPSMLLENLKLIFGESESFRLTAVSFKDEDPELSLLFFTKSLLVQIRNSSADKNLVEAYIDILADLLREIEKENTIYDNGSDEDSNADDEMTEQINNILTVLEREIRLHFPDIIGNESIREKALIIRSIEKTDKKNNYNVSSEIKKDSEKNMSIQQAVKNTDNKNPAGSAGKVDKAENPVQLELFF